MKNRKVIIIAVIAVVLVLITTILVINNNYNKRDYTIEKVKDYNYFVLVENNQYGVIDKNGKKIIDTKYDNIKIPNPSKGVFIATQNSKNKVLNENGEEIFSKYELVDCIRLKNIASDLMYEKSVLTYSKDGKYGLIDLNELESSIREDTILVSIMAANNEIGTLMPLKEIGSICKKHKVLFHTDAVQAYGNIPIDVNEMNIDLLSTSAHKIEGPKGIGFLYVRKGVMITPLISGGMQEKGKRAGTTNAAGIIGFAKAAELKFSEIKKNNKYVLNLREHLIDRVLSEIPYVRLNGSRDKRLVGNANFSFQFIEGEGMLLKLDALGICASSGSACTSGSLDPSHVLLAIGLPHEIAHGSLRLTMNHENTMEEIDYTVDKLKEVISGLRSMSPLYEDFVKKGSN